MIYCLINLRLLVNLKLKVHISGNLEPGTYPQYQIENAHLIKEYEKHIYLTNMLVMLAKCPLFKEQ